MRIQLLTAAVLVAAAASARSLGISLEENRGQQGSIGYVDLQAVFHRFPQTLRAKESYAEVVRKAEEQVDIKKAALIELDAELTQLKAQRDEAAKAPLFVAPATPALVVAPSTATAPALSTGTARPPAVSVSSATRPAAAPATSSGTTVGGLPGMEAPASTAPLRINIPGLPAESLSAAPPQASTATAALPPVTPPPAAPPGAALQAQAEAALRARDAKVRELDASVAAKQAEIDAKQKSLGVYEADLEKSLVDIESKRSEMLLGRIYLAVRQTAIESGVSVVIDKSAILYGQPSVDLTDKVLKKLEETQP